MQSHYQLWKPEKFIRDLAREQITQKIDGFIKGLNTFYGLVGMERIDILIIYGYIQDYLKKYPNLKLIDLDRAIELYKKRPDLNKLCPEYFETIFDKYRKSDERKQIYKEWENDLDQHKSELKEQNPLTSDELLKQCFEYWKQTGNILLNSGLVYLQNYQAIKDKIGIEKMHELKTETQVRLIKEHSEAIEKMSRKSSIYDEANLQLELIKNGDGLVKIETRKEHLKHYFEMIEFEAV